VSGPAGRRRYPPELPEYEALTPIQVEQQLTRSITRLVNAQRALQRARDEETSCEIDYRRALWAATLDPTAPTVERGGFTVAERDAWVSQRAEEQWVAYRIAQTKREAAQDHLRTVRDVVEVLRSLGASVRTAYEGAGYSGGA
jgi:hypothetical protein